MQVHAYPAPTATVAFAKTQIDTILHSLSPEELDRVAGLGIAIPFFLWNWARHLGVPEERMASWLKADIRGEIAAHVDFPVFLENDASAACGAELVFGPKDGPRDFLYFYVGYFIGGGVVLNGRLVTGRGNAGALGPMPVPDGKGGLCSLIDVASLSVLTHRLGDAGHETQTMWENADDWSVDEAILDDWVMQAAQGLAYAIASACALLDFEAVRIDGWMPERVRAALVAAVREALGRIDFTGLAMPEVQCGSIGPDARALGAASIPLSTRFLIEQPIAQQVE
jgi:predicted NBD/HSP70 family sugar kinase